MSRVENEIFELIFLLPTIDVQMVLKVSFVLVIYYNINLVSKFQMISVLTLTQIMKILHNILDYSKLTEGRNLNKRSLKNYNTNSDTANKATKTIEGKRYELKKEGRLFRQLFRRIFRKFNVYDITN